MAPSKLDQIRSRLDALDRSLVTTLAERNRMIAELAELKAEHGLALRDRAREQEMLARLSALGRQLGLGASFVRTLFRTVIDDSIRHQQGYLIDLRNPGRDPGRQLTVAFQGSPGAYSQSAAEHHFASHRGELECRGYDSFASMLDAVATAATDYGMLPVENTTAGSINEAYDLLAQHDLAVVGEEVLRVEHCLVGLSGAKLAEIRRVYSHPQALLQCSVFLSSLGSCAMQAFIDTAGSARKVRDEADASQAAVASERAAELYGLDVLARDIQNQHDNYTRFMVVARAPLVFDERIACKTSLIISTRHEQGALVRCLNVLAERGLNLTKLESRPRPSSPFEYLFYIDFEGNLESEPVRRAVDQMRTHTSSLKVLGSYPRALGPWAERISP